MTFRFGEIEAILADTNGIPSSQRTSFQSRLKDIMGRGLLRMETQPRGKATSYGLRELALLSVSIEMCQFGLSTVRAVEVMLVDEYPLWQAVNMAANAIEQRPDVFTTGADGDLWGFSAEWNDSFDTDPFSMFLYFDPSVLAPWAQSGDGDGEDVASSTFFFAGAGEVGRNLSRWTTGPSRRIAMINVTKLLFDLAVRVAGFEGLEVCKHFAQVAQDYMHRGDFDLDGWLANVARSTALLTAAKPDRSDGDMMPLAEVLDPADPKFGRYVALVSEEMRDERNLPAALLRLPGQRELKVDTKIVPMSDIPQLAIKMRVDELAEQPYASRFADSSKWTVLYIPNESFFADAMAGDSGIVDRALSNNVLLATPAILLDLLVEIDLAWLNYRRQHPDLGEDEYGALETEYRWYLDPEVAVDASKLPPRE